MRLNNLTIFKSTSLVLFSLYSSLQATSLDQFYRDDHKNVVIDTQQQLMWQDGTMGIEKNFIDAQNYCRALEFADYSDWYLPALSELKSIVVSENYPKAIQSSFKNVYDDYYWSSTAYSDKYAWMVLFIYTDVIYYHQREQNYVRCVRKIF